MFTFTCYSRYSKGVSAVETILLVDRLRQQVACQNHQLFHVYVREDLSQFLPVIHVKHVAHLPPLSPKTQLADL